MINMLTTALSPLNTPLSDHQYQQLAHYLEQLEKWNKTYNLTAIRDRQKMISHHIVDSLTLLPYLTSPNVIDIGTGAGLPGILLAIANPDMSVSLLDSNGKKCRFLRHIKGLLQLDNVTIFHQRVEQHTQQYDAVTARALSSLTELWQWAQPLLQPNGKLWAMKGQLPTEEINKFKSQFCVDIQSHQLAPLATDQSERHIIEISAG